MIKRTIDIVISTVALILLLPLLILIFCAIKIEDGKAPLFYQQRYGKREKAFLLYKFRTMRIATLDEFRNIEDLKDDNRITKAGRFLRSCNLDELPQLINIIKGDMSIVGPRPIPCIMKVKRIANWKCRSTIRPGLTGMAQIYCTKYTSLRSKFKFDALYVKRMNLWLDIKIIVATAWSIKPLLAFVLWTGVILLATLLPIAEEGIPAGGAISQIDKVAHFLLFTIMAVIAFYFGISFLANFWRSIWFAIGWGILLAIGTEFAQSFLPLRNMSFFDIVADMIGIGCVTLSLTLSRLPYERQAV